MGASWLPTHHSRCSNLAPAQTQIHGGVGTRLGALVWVVLLLSSSSLVNLGRGQIFAGAPGALYALPPRFRDAQDRLRTATYGHSLGVFFIFKYLQVREHLLYHVESLPLCRLPFFQAWKWLRLLAYIVLLFVTLLN